MEWGVALNTSTNIESVLPLLGSVSVVQCMGIEKIGYQGQPFDERVLSHIRFLREHNADLLISVDGSIHRETVVQVVNAGANRLVVGSALFNKEDISDAYTKLILEMQ